MSSDSKVTALTESMQEELLDAFQRLAKDSSVRAIVLTGIGRTFCVGADLDALHVSGSPGSPTSLGNRSAKVMELLTNAIVLAMRRLPIPVICALNGATAGAGVGLALASDVVIAAQTAYFYLPFMPRLGIVPDMGASWFIVRHLGLARATALTLLGERLSAAQAAEWGLIWACVEQAALMPQAMEMARRMIALPAHAVLETRRLFDAAGSNSLAEQLEYERSRQRELIDRPEFMEGVLAFKEKREPVFPGRTSD